jgi:hypothetical protein
MTPIGMKNIQHVKLEAQGGWHDEAQVYTWDHEFYMTLECRVPNFGPFMGASQCPHSRAEPIKPTNGF